MNLLIIEFFLISLLGNSVKHQLMKMVFGAVLGQNLKKKIQRLLQQAQLTISMVFQILIFNF